MTRFFSEICLVEGADGTLEPLARAAGVVASSKRHGLDDRAAAARRELQHDAAERAATSTSQPWRCERSAAPDVERLITLPVDRRPRFGIRRPSTTHLRSRGAPV